MSTKSGTITYRWLVGVLLTVVASLLVFARNVEAERINKLETRVYIIEQTNQKMYADIQEIKTNVRWIEQYLKKQP